MKMGKRAFVLQHAHASPLQSTAPRLHRTRYGWSRYRCWELLLQTGTSFSITRIECRCCEMLKIRMSGMSCSLRLHSQGHPASKIALPSTESRNFDSPRGQDCYPAGSVEVLPLQVHLYRLPRFSYSLINDSRPTNLHAERRFRRTALS